MNRKDLSKKLKQARIEAGIKQEEIAEYMNLPISGICIIEKGERRVEVTELLKFAEFYNKPVEWFFYDNEEEVNSRRWYDKDEKLSEAVRLLQKAPKKYQHSCACAIIGFLKNSGLVK